MTALEEQALKLPKIQKISLMEAICSDLTKESMDFAPPTWHLQALEETERRIAEGLDVFEDWKDARLPLLAFQKISLRCLLQSRYE